MSWKFKKLQLVWENIKYKLPKTGTKVTFIPYFNPPLMNTPSLVRTNHLDAFQMFGNMAGLSRFRVHGFRCEDVILLHFYLQKLRINVKT